MKHAHESVRLVQAPTFFARPSELMYAETKFSIPGNWDMLVGKLETRRYVGELYELEEGTVVEVYR
jgi:hypothetical protein